MDEAWVRALVALPFGLAIGSFMTVVVARVPRGESVLRPRSRCPRCATELRNRDNIPFVSWLLLGGRCRTCGERLASSRGVLFQGDDLVHAGCWRSDADPLGPPPPVS